MTDEETPLSAKKRPSESAESGPHASVVPVVAPTRGLEPPRPTPLPAGPGPLPEEPEEEHAPGSNGSANAGAKTAQQLFEDARAKATSFLQGQPGKPNVDKYFGSKLPPVCRQLGCYVTDDGKFFYCINPHCHKDKKRETKYNRRKKSVVYFFCPKCKSREIQLHLKGNNYECLDCGYGWKH